MCFPFQNTCVNSQALQSISSLTLQLQNRRLTSWSTAYLLSPGDLCALVGLGVTGEVERLLQELLHELGHSGHSLLHLSDTKLVNSASWTFPATLPPVYSALHTYPINLNRLGDGLMMALIVLNV